MRKPSQPTPSELVNLCRESLGFIVIAVHKDVPGYLEGRVIECLWGAVMPSDYIVTGRAKKKDWQSMIDLANEKWPGAFTAHARNADGHYFCKVERVIPQPVAAILDAAEEI